MKAVYALYPDADAAQRAVHGLRAAGVTDPDITVISGEPIEGYELGRRDRDTWMWWIAAAGGLTGLTLGTWLTWMTETAWPLPTGNMPIVSWWPNLIVMFELTMLGGILAAVVTLLVTAGLPSVRAKIYDPEVTNGKILVGVENPATSLLSAIERALVVGGAQVKKVGTA